MRREIDQGGLKLPEKGGAALEDTEEVQGLVGVFLIDVEGKLMNPILYQSMGNENVRYGVLVLRRDEEGGYR